MVKSKSRYEVELSLKVSVGNALHSLLVVESLTDKTDSRSKRCCLRHYFQKASFLGIRLQTSVDTRCKCGASDAFQKCKRINVDAGKL